MCQILYETVKLAEKKYAFSLGQDIFINVRNQDTYEWNP